MRATSTFTLKCTVDDIGAQIIVHLVLRCKIGGSLIERPIRIVKCEVVAVRRTAVRRPSGSGYFHRF